MRTDAFGPRTWLLAGVALWALLAWVLALFGMGGHIRPLADDPALVSALPQLPPKVPERLGPLSDYAEIAARPVTSPNRQPQPFFIAGDQDQQKRDFDYVLSSVLITPKLQLAILQPAQGGEGLRLKVGEAPPSLPAWRMVELAPRSAVFDGPEGRRTLELRVFDGTGAGMSASGQAPPMSSPMPVPAPSAASANPSPTGGPAPPMGGNAPAMPQAQPTASPAVPQGQPMSTEQQMDVIRKRIEARRAQLREQQGASPSPPDKNK